MNERGMVGLISGIQAGKHGRRVVGEEMGMAWITHVWI